ncbi:hypothetical protein SMD20_28220 [Nonomuraea sp. LP-02]|uniref:hypothetical protein n=1 Tax=Nonomuraea sp. LP-02 TaxID=3097960 RepID=UPI002E31E36B|nr:hypothetical protein [Nonomuraea sp. LP-02]MED7928174.1 hypothetical protein [Nonomuraea sp. LP-02]
MSTIARRLAVNRGWGEGWLPEIDQGEGLMLWAEAETRRSRSSEAIALLGQDHTIEAARRLNRAVWRMEQQALNAPADGEEEWWKSVEDFANTIGEFHESARRELGVQGKYLPPALDPSWL